MLDAPPSEDLFELVQFDLEIPCFAEERHPDDDHHRGSSEATHYLRMQCPTCEYVGVTTICGHFANWINLCIIEGVEWDCPTPDCESTHFFDETCELTLIDFN